MFAIFVPDFLSSSNLWLRKCHSYQEPISRTLMQESCFSVPDTFFFALTLRNLAVLAAERGDRAEARRLWRMVLDACPGDAEAMSRGEA